MKMDKIWLVKCNNNIIVMLLTHSLTSSKFAKCHDSVFYTHSQQHPEGWELNWFEWDSDRKPWMTHPQYFRTKIAELFVQINEQLWPNEQHFLKNHFNETLNSIYICHWRKFFLSFICIKYTYIWYTALCKLGCKLSAIKCLWKKWQEW